MRRKERSLGRRLRVLAVAVGAMLAVCAASASAASAYTFEAEEYPAYGIGKSTEPQEFKVGAGSIQCSEVTYTGTIAEASETLRVKAQYNGCTAFSLPAEVSMGGCEYEFRMKEEPIAGYFKGEDAIVNATGKSCAEHPITMKAITCTVTSGPQEGLHTVEATDLNGSSWLSPPHPPWAEVESTSVITNAKYTESSGCITPGEHGNGEYIGTTLIKVYNEIEEQIGGRVV